MSSRPYTKTCRKGHGEYAADFLDEECPACADQQPPAFAVGDRVFWNDPDMGSCSGPGTISGLGLAEGEEMADDTVIHIDKDDGGEVAAVADEVDLLQGNYVRIRHTIELVVDLNGTAVSEVKENLERLGQRAYAEGDFTGATPAEVGCWRQETVVEEE